MTRRKLQRLQPIEDEQCTLALHQASQALAPGPRRTFVRVRVAKPAQSRADELLSGSRTVRAPLAVEGPAEDVGCASEAIPRHASQPVVDEGRLADATPSHETQDVRSTVGPGVVQQPQLSFAAEQFGVCQGETAHGHSGAREMLNV